MMNKIIFICVLCFICCSKTYNDKDIEEGEKINRNWVNSEYLECIKKNSPCQCRNNMSALLIDSLKFVEVLGLEAEPLFYKIIKIRNDQLVVLDNDTLMLKFSSKDTLKIGEAIFISNPQWEKYGKDFLARINAIPLVSNYSFEIKNLFEIDSMMIYCNPYKNIHFLKTGKSCSKQNIIEYTNDSIYICDFVNSCDSKKINFSIDKKIIKKFAK